MKFSWRTVVIVSLGFFPGIVLLTLIMSVGKADESHQRWLVADAARVKGMKVEEKRKAALDKWATMRPGKAYDEAYEELSALMELEEQAWLIYKDALIDYLSHNEGRTKETFETEREWVEYGERVVEEAIRASQLEREKQEWKEKVKRETRQKGGE